MSVRTRTGSQSKTRSAVRSRRSLPAIPCTSPVRGGVACPVSTSSSYSNAPAPSPLPRCTCGQRTILRRPRKPARRAPSAPSPPLSKPPSVARALLASTATRRGNRVARRARRGSSSPAPGRPLAIAAVAAPIPTIRPWEATRHVNTCWVVRCAPRGAAPLQRALRVKRAVHYALRGRPLRPRRNGNHCRAWSGQTPLVRLNMLAQSINPDPASSGGPQRWRRSAPARPCVRRRRGVRRSCGSVDL